MQKGSPLLSSVVVCRNSQGAEITANILRLRRYSVAFEVYNPYSILQLSEVLRDFRIRIGDRVVYQGEAVVAGLVNTGILLVCEATLGNAWLDVDFLSDREGREPLDTQFDSFVHDWKRAHEVDANFKLTVADMQNLLIGLQRWLEQIDLDIRATATMDRVTLEREVINQLETRVIEEVAPLMTGFEDAVRNVQDGREATHKFYVRRQIHPLVLCSPFTYRTFHKPLGYAGDYEMVNMMVRDPYEGGSLFAKILNRAFLQSAPVEAHRNRIDYLVDVLRTHAEKNVQAGRRTRVLNLGCGPAHEVQRFLETEEVSDMCDFTLLDFNEETIEYTNKRLTQARTQNGRVTPINVIQRSVHQLLRQASTGDVDLPWESFDIVYCAGLFDYLSQRVCKRLTELFYRLLVPGGFMTVTNVSASNPNKSWMEYILEWNLIYRDDPGMLDLTPGGVDHGESELRRDETGVNLFLEIRKRAANGGGRKK
ncbi:MAG: class I SAM-dependent methyltransferase [Akkermansiaceae bacterium]|nr:class I SAM-dependent methyltransferase [Akkermansiaceae bacterium]NNM28435.1 class I SAM-dependent methyltransferase [Akkermansiaceae bacterium]